MLTEIQGLMAEFDLGGQGGLILGVGLGAMLLIFGVAGAMAPRDPALRRMAEQGRPRRPDPVEAGLLRADGGDPTGLMKSFMPADRKERSQVQRQLAEAGLRGPNAVRNFYLGRLVFGLVLPGVLMALMALMRQGLLPSTAGLGAWLAALSPMGLLQALAVLVGVGFFGPTYWLKTRINARRRAIRETFPNVLDLLQISVESGLSFDAAMIRVANESRESAPELSEEFLITQREIQAGRPRDRALSDMAERTGVPEIGSFAGAVVQSIRYGAAISDALLTYAEEMRTQRELNAQEMANKLPVKLSAVMASLMLPALFIIALGPVVIRFSRYVAGG